MSYQVLEIANPARLSVRDSQLVIERDGFLPFVTPACDIHTLLLANPQITLTQGVIASLTEAGAAVVMIGPTFLPLAMMLPLQNHTLQTERLARQVALSVVARKRLWTQIVRAKITAQGSLLKEFSGTDAGLLPMAQRIRSGDPDNFEAQAARIYWRRIFADAKFRRGADASESGLDQNRHLDYGYTVLRAAVARSICAAGLHPSLGLRHHNRYDPFCLASDLMEPFRPLIDRRVSLWLKEHDPGSPLDSAAKRWLIQGVTMRYWLLREERTLSDILTAVAVSLAGVMAGERKTLFLPEGLQPCQEDLTSRRTDVCG